MGRISPVNSSKSISMEAFGNIVLFHPAAIGDALLASPVAATLKLNFPAARLTYWSHPELRQLMHGLCPPVDEFVDYSRDTSLMQLVKMVEKLQPDLFVDLSNSNKTRFIPWLSRSRTKVARYRKNPPGVRQHAVDNFLDTIRPLCQEMPPTLFPSIFPEALVPDVIQRLFPEGGLPQTPLIGLVPGVGKHRPHRAWLHDGWVYLLRHLQSQSDQYSFVLIGGADEVELCESLCREAGDGVCLNVAGKLSLSETAALLKICQLVISGDTGPAHMAVAVGTKVIGLYGPTLPSRSGPYGCDDLVIDQSRSCQCGNLKYCRLSNPSEAGECMHRIMLPEILEKIELAFGRELPELIP